MKKVFKYVLFVTLSTILSVLFFYVYITFKTRGWGDGALFFYVSPTLGATTGILLIITHEFLLKNHDDKKKFYAVRILVFILIYIFFYLIFMHGNDMLFKVQSYFELV